MGTKEISPTDRVKAQVELEKLFTSYALGRVVEHGNCSVSGGCDA